MSELDTLGVVYTLVKVRASALGVSEQLVSKHLQKATSVYSRVIREDSGDGYVKAEILPSTVEKRNGKQVKPYRVYVSEHYMMCTCPTAITTAARAGRLLEEAYWRREKWSHDTAALATLAHTLAARHTLCKHTLALLARGLAAGRIKLTARLVDNITLSIATLAIAEGEVTPRLTSELAKLLQKAQAPAL